MSEPLRPNDPQIEKLALAWQQTMGKASDAIGFRDLYNLQLQAASTIQAIATAEIPVDEITQLLCMLEADMLIQAQPNQPAHIVLYNSLRWLDWHRQITAQRVGRRELLSNQKLEIAAPEAIPPGYYALHGLSRDSSPRLAILSHTRQALNGMRFTQLAMLDRVISAHR